MIMKLSSEAMSVRTDAYTFFPQKWTLRYEWVYTGVRLTQSPIMTILG